LNLAAGHNAIKQFEDLTLPFVPVGAGASRGKIGPFMKNAEEAMEYYIGIKVKRREVDPNESNHIHPIRPTGGSSARRSRKTGSQGKRGPD
jgi:hypothetical protein